MTDNAPSEEQEQDDAPKGITEIAVRGKQRVRNTKLDSRCSSKCVESSFDIPQSPM